MYQIVSRCVQVSAAGPSGSLGFGAFVVPGGRPASLKVLFFFPGHRQAAGFNGCAAKQRWRKHRLFVPLGIATVYRIVLASNGLLFLRRRIQPKVG